VKLEQFVTFGIFSGTSLRTSRLVPIFYGKLRPAGAQTVWLLHFMLQLTTLSYSTQQHKKQTKTPILPHRSTCYIGIVGKDGRQGSNHPTKNCYENRVLWYLHTVLTFQSHVNPTSRHCDIIPANPSWIPDISRYHFRTATSSSSVELVYSIRILFETNHLILG